MTNQTDSFIDEVTEAVRRDRLDRSFRRYGWIAGLVILLIVGGAAAVEWRRAQAQAAAELRGEALISGLELPDGEARVAALGELAGPGEAGFLASLLLAGALVAEGRDGEAAVALDRVAADGAVPPLWRDLAALKSLLIAARDPAGLEAERGALEALAAPGAPFRLLALETLGLAELAAGNRDAAAAALGRVVEDADVGPSQLARVEALRLALAAPTPAAAAPALRAFE